MMGLRHAAPVGLVLVGIAPWAPAAAQGSAAVPTTAFVNVSVVPMDRERVLPAQTVLVQGSRIVALGPTSRVAIPAGATRIDGRGRYLMPGLADMHVHFAAVDSDRSHGLRWTLNPKLPVADMLFTFVANGVTTVRDMHSGPNSKGEDWALTLRQRVATGELLGPRIYTAGDPNEASPVLAAQSVEALKRAGYDFLKIYGQGRPLYDSLVTAAHRVGLAVAGHVPSHGAGVGLTQVLKDRWASTEHLMEYWEEATVTAKPQQIVDDSTLSRLAREIREAGVWSCPTLTAVLNLYGRFFGLTDSVVSQRVNFYPRMVKALQDAGAGLILGTDANSIDAFSFGGSLAWSGFAIHRELETLVEQAGLTPYQALAAGTSNVARFLGAADSTGTVAVGKRADLILLKRNPLADIRNTAALAGVMVGGRWLSRATLEHQIDSLWQAQSDGAQNEVNEKATPAAQIRLLSRLLWR